MVNQNIWNEAEWGVLLDHYKPQCVADTRLLVEGLNTDLVYIPTCCTSFVQTMVISGTVLFKEE